MPSLVEIGPLVWEKKIFEGFLPLNRSHSVGELPMVCTSCKKTSALKTELWVGCGGD